MAACDPARADALALRVAELLFANGQTTERIGVAVERLGRVAGRPISVAARWGELTIQSDDGLPVRQIAAQPSGVDIRKVMATERVADEFCACRIDVDDATAKLAAIARLPPVSLPRFATMAAAGAAALGVIFGAADVLTVVVIALGAGLGAVLRRAVSRISVNPLAQPFAAALLAGALASLAIVLQLPVSYRLAAICPCMVLVPGPHFLNGCIDLARARIPLGAARLAFASLIAMAISAGLLAGLSITTPMLPAEQAPTPVALGLDVLAAGVAVAAYGAFFNMPWRLLPIPIGVGMIAHALRWQILASGAALPTGAFAACLLVGAAMTPLSHWFRLPFGASAFAAVVSLIPGIYMFETASAALELISHGPAGAQGVVIALIQNVTMATTVLLAMATGLIAPKMILDGLFPKVSAQPVRTG